MHAVPTRAELLAAVEDHDPGNSLGVEIAVAVASYANILGEQAECKKVVHTVVLPMPHTETEAFALELFSTELAAMGIHVIIKGNTSTARVGAGRRSPSR